MYNFYISGQPRFFKQGYALWKKYLFEPNGGIDNFNIYLHAWFDAQNLGQAYDGGPWLNDGKLDYATQNTDLELLNIYRPDAYHIEPPKFVSCSKDYSRYCTATPPHALFSYYYSMQQSIRLCNSTENNISVWGRYDIVPASPINLLHYQEDGFYVPDDVLPNSENKEACNTNIIIANANNMRYLSNLFDKMDDYWENDGVRMGGECLTGWHLHKSGKKKILSTIPYHIIRNRVTDSNEILAASIQV